MPPNPLSPSTNTFTPINTLNTMADAASPPKPSPSPSHNQTQDLSAEETNLLKLVSAMKTEECETLGIFPVTPAKGTSTKIGDNNANTNTNTNTNTNADVIANANTPASSAGAGTATPTPTPSKRPRKTASSTSNSNATPTKKSKKDKEDNTSNNTAPLSTSGANANATGGGGKTDRIPIPTSYDTASPVDRMILRMRDEENRPWTEITAAFAELTGVKVGASTVRMRYTTMKANFVAVTEADATRFLRIKKEVEEKFEVEKWHRIAEGISQDGGCKYPPQALLKKFKEMNRNSTSSSSPGLASVKGEE